MEPSDGALVINDDSSAQATEMNVAVDEDSSWINQTVLGYLKGENSIDHVAALLAERIEEAFSTGDHGVLIWESERDAEFQRARYRGGDVEEVWGLPEDIPIPKPSQSVINMPTTEGQLWGLWGYILHAARHTPWTDHTEQEKLISLVRALKARPEPPMPERMTVAMRNNWVWEAGALWSATPVLGASAREDWNFCPGSNMGFTLPEQHGWANLNAFVARLTANNLYDFKRYMMWGMREAFEKPVNNISGTGYKVSEATRLGATAMAAAVWVLVAGEAMYEKREREDKGWSGEELELWEAGQNLPWKGSEVVNGPRWTFWRRGFHACSENEELTEEVRAMCREAAAKAVSYEQAASHRS